MARGKEKKAKVSAKHLAISLRKELLTKRGGEFFGLEDDLLARLDVSRPTLRQAARVLEHDQLLRVQRGPRGGYYVARPDVQSVINAASLYLHERGTSLKDLITASRGLVSTMVRLAARCKDVDARAEIQRQLDVYTETDFTSLPHTRFLRAEAEIFTVLAHMAANPPLELVIQILYGCGLSLTTEKIFDGRPDRIAACAKLRIQLVEAVLAHDGELAQIHDERASKLRTSYLEEDEGSGAESMPGPHALPLKSGVSAE